MSSSRRDRSRSPSRLGSSSRRRDKHQDNDKGSNSALQNSNQGLLNSNSGLQNSMINHQQMMMNNMYPQGNVMMGGGMYSNLMMPNAIMGAGMMPSTGMDMMPSGNIDLMSQPAIDMSSMSSMGVSTQSMPSMTPMPSMPSMPTTTGSMEIGMMTPQMSNMMLDPSVMGNIGIYPQGEIAAMGEKKEIVLAHCKLTPPDPSTPIPPRRPKPPGCRTIFIGGLPDNIRESIIREIFENYGRIHILRLSTKNFCHIRFDREGCVDAAMTLSGYRIKLVNKDEEEEEDTKANAGWLHVDYALSRDDQNEYEKRQRQALRAQEAQMQQMCAQQRALADVNRSMYRQSSPPRVQPFSNVAIAQLLEKIKSEEHFAITLPTLITWLERGECSKKNSTQFYSMIQATNSHIRRLFNEKMQAEEELQEVKDRIKLRIQQIIDQQPQCVETLTNSMKTLEHMTNGDGKRTFVEQIFVPVFAEDEEFNSLREEFYEKFNEDNEFNGYNMNRGSIDMDDSRSDDEVKQLKLENDSLKFQLEAYKNEIDVIRADSQKELEKFKAQFIARQALQGAFDQKNTPPLPSPVKKPPPPPPLPDDLEMSPTKLKETVECGEAKLIGVMAAFLQVHPQGASLDYVVSYVRALFPRVSQAAVHRVLQKHADAFQRTTTGVGANIEHRWSFVAYRPDPLDAKTE